MPRPAPVPTSVPSRRDPIAGRAPDRRRKPSVLHVAAMLRRARANAAPPATGRLRRAP